VSRLKTGGVAGYAGRLESLTLALEVKLQFLPKIGFTARSLGQP
jgi:hypothetical protein